MNELNFTQAATSFATGVVIVNVRDDLDDVAMTATSFLSLSRNPPMVSVTLDEGTHLREVLERQDEWTVSILQNSQRATASRCGVSGRPSARLLLDGEPHHRGKHTGALILDNGLAGLECRTVQRVVTGDHLLLIAEVLEVDYVHPERTPLVRFRRRYRALS
ncbi:MAG: flavin reductase family protein [Corynebacteriales bacterium]|nr:flavin reductase family protein [Mycobacteriales bacterium]